MSKIAIVTDTHLSVRNDLESLMDYQNRFWKDHFFPELKKRKIKEIFQFRHRIIHVDPLLTMLNNHLTREPIFSTSVVKTAISDFNDFIELLHKKTLENKIN